MFCNLYQISARYFAISFIQKNTIIASFPGSQPTSLPHKARHNDTTMFARRTTLATATRLCTGTTRFLPRKSLAIPARSYTTEHLRPPKQEATNFTSLTYKSILFLGLSGLGLVTYFNYEKKRVEKEREEAHRKNLATGKPLVGGPFSLVDHHGRPVTDLDFRGKWMLMYFGYTFCPDVCPDELDKMAKVVDTLKQNPQTKNETVVPIFVSCDPKRDSCDVIREYLKEFHPDFLGLTGTYAQIKRAAKAYRIYYSAPPRSLDDDEDDYLVDHSIFFYLVDPEGVYRAHFGKIDTAERAVEKCTEEMVARRKRLAI